MSEFVNPHYAKSDEYGDVIGTIADGGYCPFCPDHFVHHKNPILHRVGNWVVTESSWPYAHAERHFLIIGDRHISLFTDLSDADLADIRAIVAWTANAYRLDGYGLTVRCGETDRTGATVQHLHFHMIIPKLGPDGKAITVNFPIG